LKYFLLTVNSTPNTLECRFSQLLKEIEYMISYMILAAEYVGVSNETLLLVFELHYFKISFIALVQKNFLMLI